MIRPVTSTDSAPPVFGELPPGDELIAAYLSATFDGVTTSVEVPVGVLLYAIAALHGSDQDVHKAIEKRASDPSVLARAFALLEERQKGRK